jgi:hypothetical protein
MSETFSTHEKAINTEKIAVVEPRGKTAIGTCTAELFLEINFICLVICYDSVACCIPTTVGEKLLYLKILSFKRSLTHEIAELKIHL